MKAIVQNAYGGSEVLRCAEIPAPEIAESDVLIRTHAVSLNAGDTFFMRGSPWMIRFWAGFPKPRNRVLGWDVTGVVEAVGTGVRSLRPGDEVYTACEAAFAEFVKANVHSVGRKPAGISFAEAAAIPTAGLTALQGLRDHGTIRDGQSVLINGASGGVGHFSVQIAKSFGWRVTGVCSTGNVEMVRSLGAHNVVDYTSEDFTRSTGRYDLIFDMAASRALREMKRVLTDDGFVLTNSGHGGMRYVLKSALAGAVSRKVRTMPVARSTSEDLAVLAGMVDAGTLRPVIDRTLAFDDIPTGLDYVAEAHARGKVVAELIPG